ncbi:MAG TPA: hypothetical protein VEL82_00465 [Thermoplasmata archaeon]|nr:hypothetical protein [Thermoplasmata archaeon]
MPDAEAESEPDWRRGVEVREDPGLTGVLLARMPPPGAPRDVSVTELIAPRIAYWRAISPVLTSPERAERLERGKAWHRRIGLALATEGELEARVRRSGVVGRIDLLAQLPVEIKTSGAAVAREQLPTERPEQIEQLAVYAALAGRPRGRLLLVDGDPGADVHFALVDVEFPDLGTTWREVAQRVSAIRTAWRVRSPSGLPRCRWFDRGCEFRDADVCDCRGTEPEASGALQGGARVLAEPPEDSAAWGKRVRAAPPASGPLVARFRDLLYPRRAYFERTVAAEPMVPFRPDPSRPPDLYERLRSALESGPPGEVSLVPSRTDEPAELGLGFRGDPFLLRSLRGGDPPQIRSLLDQQPQYVLELGWRAVATGRAHGRLVLGWERAASPSEQLRVADVRFSVPTLFARTWRQRLRSLGNALASRSPQGLLPCPDWMFRTCPYAPGCACAAPDGRSQR